MLMDCNNNRQEVKVSHDRIFGLSNLPGFDLDRTSDWEGCTGWNSTSITQEMCDELNALTGNKWNGKKYKEFCDTYDWPWTVEEVVYALFHGGKYPEKKEEEWFAWKIEESIDSDQDAIAFFYMCQYEDDSERCNKYEQVDVKPLNEEVLSAFAGWEIEEDWEKNNFVTFWCSNKDTYGYKKMLKLYNGYLGRFLSCRMLNFDEKEKEMVLTLLQKYYNHVSSDFDINKARQASEPEMPGLSDLLGLGASDEPVTREFLEENWAVSSYNEDTPEQIDYYIHELKCFPGEKAYCYSHEDEELRELEIVHVIARMDNAALYDELIQNDDVLINGEEEYGADCSAEFMAKFSSYLVWFKGKEE